MKKFMKRISVVSCILLIIGLMSGCGSSTNVTKEETIKIGTIYPLTGDVAAIGNNIMKGINFAVDEINSKGGIKGKKIEIVKADTQGDPKVAKSEIERLISKEKVVAILGAYQSGVTDTISQDAESNQVPLITAISTADVITTHGYKYLFRLAPTNSMYLRDMINFAKDYSDQKSLGLKTIAICADNSLLGQETSKWATYWAKQVGMESLGDVLYTKGAADLTTEVNQLKKINPDILIVDNYISDGILLTKTLAEQGYKPKMMIAKATAYIDPSYLPAVGGLANGIFTASEFNPGTKGKEVSDAFKQKYGVDMNGHSAEAYTAVWTLKTALENATDLTGPSIQKALENVKIEGSFSGGNQIILPYDVVNFSDTEINGVKHTNTNTGAKLTIVQIQNGKYETVWPFNIKQADPIYPAQYK